jgi:hypothetical protein
MDPKRENLIAWMLGDLSPEASRPLEAKLAGDADMQAERANLERTLTLIKSVPSDDVSDVAVAHLLAAAEKISPEGGAVESAENAEESVGELIQLDWFRRVLPRVAALVMIAFVFGLAVWFTPGDLPDQVADVVDDTGSHPVLEGELVESRAGNIRHIRFATGEVLMDGASAVRVNSNGQYAAPSFEVERGRVVVTASTTSVSVNVAGREVQMDKGAMLAVNYDRAYANIAADGSVVEVQRMPVGQVARLAEKAYGIKLDAGALPKNVASQRITFYGSNLDKDAFKESFIESASAFGVILDESGSYLRYEPRSGRVQPNEEWQLDIALLEGSANLKSADTNLKLADSTANFVTLSAEQSDKTAPRILEAAELDSQVVWAAGAGGALGERLHDVKPSVESLPSGSVIHTDSLVLNGEMGKRIYKLGGDFNFPLPGGRKGRLVQLTTSGALFEVKGEVVREFVPFGEQNAESKD